VRIAHVCLAGAYTEGMSYQDNMLVDINRRDGHEVLIVSDCRRFEGGQIVETAPEEYFTENGARLVRLPFDWMGPGWLTNKIKRCRRLIPLLEEFRPDVILYHGVIGWELLSLGKYKRGNPDVRIYVDSHEDRHNSATTWLSHRVQYRLLFRSFIWRALPYIEKILYISLETRDFLRDVLDLPDSVLEYYPLGGIVVPDEERRRIRKDRRAALVLSDTDIVFFHSGKLDAKKRTAELLAAFRSVRSPNARLLIVGSMEDDVRDALGEAIAADSRVMNLGWMDRDGLNAIMCTADVYVQPGGQSASLQHAICCGLPVLTYPHPSYGPFLRGNGYFVETEADMTRRMTEIVLDPDLLPPMREASYEVAYDLLDYRKLAARIYR